VSPFTHELLAVGVDRAALQDAAASFDARDAVSIRDALTGLLSKARGSSVDVVLADAAVRYLTVAVPADADRIDELKAVAQLRLAELFDADPADWQLEADWRARGAFLACAMPARLLRALHSASAPRRLRIARIAPLFVRVANETTFKRQAWLAVRVGAHATAACFVGANCVAVRSAPLATGIALGAWVAREAELAATGEHELVLLDADNPSQAATGRRIDPDRRDVALLNALARAESEAVA